MQLQGQILANHAQNRRLDFLVMQKQGIEGRFPDHEKLALAHRDNRRRGVPAVHEAHFADERAGWRRAIASLPTMTRAMPEAMKKSSGTGLS